MPIYTYEREDGSRIEIEHSMMQAPLTEHPETGEPLKKLIVLTHFEPIFKGKDFYKTESPLSFKNTWRGRSAKSTKKSALKNC